MIEKKRRGSKLRKARKKKAKKASQRGGDPPISKEGTELNVGKAVTIHNDPKEEEKMKSCQETSALQRTNNCGKSTLLCFISNICVGSSKQQDSVKS